ncbi:MAG: hypothetical protein JRE62_11770 [Deltaproteobacteria bacterium]|jgi:hypothetical protein|nr:hypothetical protein [Deltaproteobacteria bacterium]
MKYKRLLSNGFIFILSFFLSFGPACGNAENTNDYTRLLELIQLDDRQQPLYPFNDFEEDFDRASYRATQQYFNEHPGLIERIKRSLKGGKLQWKLKNLKHRLLFVPESRPEYATLYKNYCLDVIRAILNKTGFDNPYDSIQTLNHSKPEINGAKGGVTAYVVHNLAKEYVSTYIFSDQTDKKVKIELKGQLYSGEVGAYSSTLVMNADGTIEFLKDKYTIWQNSAENPYTALMVPAEETLHIALREHTERAIRNTLAGLDPQSPKNAQKIVEDWIAVEEALIGGIVFSLLPPILEDYLRELPASWIEEDREVKNQHKKYRHLDKGISLVEEIGYQEAIRLYSADPPAFRDLLL